MGPCGRSELRSDLTNLLATFAKSEIADATPQPHSLMYNATTCVEFHRLLLAALLAYGKALCELQAGSGKPSICKRIWYSGGLIRELSSSLMLRQHLRACQSLLGIPINDIAHVEKYNEYTRFTLQGCLTPNSDHDNGAVDDAPNGSETLDLIFLKWIRLQVIYWLSLGTISRVLGCPPDPNAAAQPELPPVSLLAVAYPEQPQPLEPWMTTVNNLLSRTPSHSPSYTAKGVTDYIIDQTKFPYKYNQPAFTKWKDAQHKHDIKFVATCHCETILGSLSKWAHSMSAEQIKDHPRIAELLQVKLYSCSHDAL
jgi:hypothetical protein